MKRILLIILLCASLYSISSIAHAVANYPFARDLKYGDQSEDVRRLQQILNLSGDTQVAQSGAGSSGNETTYFGNATKRAVIRFQEKYRDEILAPNGLIIGTGYVGASTRKKLNSIYQEAPSSSQSSDISNSGGTVSSRDAGSSDTDSFSLASMPPAILSISDTNPAPGSTIMLTGVGFSNDMKVYIGDDAVNNATINAMTNTANVKVPNKNGVQQVWVENQKGNSKTNFPMFIVISSLAGAGLLPPDIALMVTQTKKLNDEITKKINDLTGQNGGSSGSSGGSGGFGGLGGSFGGSSGSSGSSGGGGGGMKDYYGGKINKVTYCTCYYNFGVMLEIQDKSNNDKTLKIFYNPFISRLWANWNIWTAGPYVIGGYWPMSWSCEMTSGYYCRREDTTSGIIDSIKGIGSSMNGAR